MVDNYDALSYPFVPPQAQLLPLLGRSQVNVLTERRAAGIIEQEELAQSQSDQKLKLDTTRLAGYMEKMHRLNATTSSGSVISAPQSVQERDRVFSRQASSFSRSRSISSSITPSTLSKSSSS